MGLTPCGECGNQVSDLATSCPRCGAPTRKVEAPSGQSEPSVPAPATHTHQSKRSRFLVLAGVAVAGILAWNLLTRGSLIPEPQYQVVSSAGDDGCTTLGDYCQRAHCLVRNVGNATGTATVTATMSIQGRSALSKSTRLGLAVGEERDIAIDFAEATIGNPYDRVICHVQ